MPVPFTDDEHYFDVGEMPVNSVLHGKGNAKK